MKRDLKAMKMDRAGERFKNEHKRVKKKGADSGSARIVCFGLAIVSAVIGVVLVFIPGPAILFFVLSGALLASQSWTMACLLDRAEVTLHKTWAAAKKRWPILRTRRGGPPKTKRSNKRPRR